MDRWHLTRKVVKLVQVGFYNVIAQNVVDMVVGPLST